MTIAEAQMKKLEQAKEILAALGFPPPQANDRSGWVFLALADVSPLEEWAGASAPLMQVYKIIEFISEKYGHTYAPNSRETIRRQTLHQFEQAQVIQRNRDDPSRSTNSKDNNYSLNPEVIKILQEYPDDDWVGKMMDFKLAAVSLNEKYERIRSMNMIPITSPSGEKFELSPGKHNQLHADIVHDFCPRFVGGGGRLLYLGDTASSRNEGGKLMHLEAEFLASIGVPPMSHDKLPDVVVFDEKRRWLFLIEAVTSHGPVSQKRWAELEHAFKDCSVGKVYVTAFPDRAEFRKNSADIAWETEVWIADNPDHMIHFNGDRFLGPHE